MFELVKLFFSDMRVFVTVLFFGFKKVVIVALICAYLWWLAAVNGKA